MPAGCVGVAGREFGRQAVAMRLAAVGRVDVAETVDRAVADGALRDLVRAAPVRVVAHRRDRPAAPIEFLRVLEQSAPLPKVLWQLPGTVGPRTLEADQQRTARDLWGR